jgi:hypothetical protein
LRRTPKVISEQFVQSRGRYGYGLGLGQEEDILEGLIPGWVFFPKVERECGVVELKSDRGDVTESIHDETRERARNEFLPLPIVSLSRR